MARWEDLGLRGGVWQGIWHGEQPPGRVSLVHLGRRVGGARVAALHEDAWRVTVALPADLLTDGVMTLLLLADEAEGEAPPGPAARRIATLPIAAGAPLAEDLRAEISLLRAELDLLKREFRRAGAARG